MKDESHAITWKYLLLGAAIVIALSLLGVILHRVIKLSIDSVASLISGLGAIVAILGIGWQTAVQLKQDENKRLEACRPFSFSMHYLAAPLHSGDVVLYSSQYAQNILGDNADKRVREVFQHYRNKPVGVIRVEIQSNSPIFNVVFKLTNDDNEHETLYKPVLSPGPTYVWLTKSVLEKIAELSDGYEYRKSGLFPEDLGDATRAYLRYTTAAHERVEIPFHKDGDPKKQYRLIQEKSIRKDVKAEYTDTTGYSTHAIEI